MYNFLIDKLPQKTPSGKRIRTDFRESIKFELLMQDNNVSDNDKIALALNLFYEQEIEDVKSALEEIIWFYKGEQKQKVSSSKSKNIKQIYSYEFDDEYILDAFIQEYKIDLNEIPYMHWWKFKALMKGLSDNTEFVKIMGYRSIDVTQIKDKEEKKKYKKLQKIYALPDMRTDEQKESDFGRAFW